MKGIIFNLLAGAVWDEQGEDVWDDLLERADLEGAWTAMGDYPHEHLLRVIDEAADMWDRSRDDVFRWFGRACIPKLAGGYGQFFEPHPSAFSFLRTLNDVHHLEVLKVYPNADLPVFSFDPPLHPGVLVMRYRSARGFCTFGEGLIEGTGDHFGEALGVHQPECVHRGDASCQLVISTGGGSLQPVATDAESAGSTVPAGDSTHG